MLPGCWWNLSRIDYRTPAVYGTSVPITDAVAPYVLMRPLNLNEQEAYFGGTFEAHDMAVYEVIIKNSTRHTFRLLGSSTGLPLETPDTAIRLGQYKTLRFCVISTLVGCAYFFPWLFAAVPMAIGMSSFNKDLKEHIERIVLGPDDVLVVRPGQTIVRYIFLQLHTLTKRTSTSMRFWDKRTCTHVCAEVPIILPAYIE